MKGFFIARLGLRGWFRLRGREVSTKKVVVVVVVVVVVAAVVAAETESSSFRARGFDVGGEATNPRPNRLRFLPERLLEILQPHEIVLQVF